MSVIITNMDMPERCGKCRFATALDCMAGGGFIKDHKQKNGTCPLKALEQEPKKGHWVDITNKNGTVIAVRCSCCEKSPKHAIKSMFCPNCGVDMRGDANEDSN